jgi:hypothetical protein
MREKEITKLLKRAGPFSSGTKVNPFPVSGSFWNHRTGFGMVLQVFFFFLSFLTDFLVSFCFYFFFFFF